MRIKLRYGIFLGLCAIGIIVFCFQISSKNIISTPEKNIISISPSELQINEVPQGTVEEVVFEVENTSLHQTAQIYGYLNSCSCVWTTVDKKVLNPGEKALMHVKIDTSSRKGTLNLYAGFAWTCDNVQISTEVPITVDVVTVVECDVSKIDFSKVAAPTSCVLPLRKGTDTKMPWDAISVSSKSPSLTCKQINTHEGIYEFEVTLDPSALPRGSFSSALQIQCMKDNSPVHYLYEIPVSAQILGSVESKPPSLYLGVLPSPEKRTLSAQLRSKTGTPLELLSIESSHPDFATATATSQSGAEIKLLCTFDPSSAKANQSGRFLLRTRINGKEETLAIPFIAFVKSP